jgi:hypothetical protein
VFNNMVVFTFLECYKICVKLLYHRIFLTKTTLIFHFAHSYCRYITESSRTLIKGTVSPDILILFMMSIIKSVLFVWPLIPLCFFIASLILYLFTKF